MHEISSAGTSLGPEFDNVVGLRDQIQMMFDHHHGVPLINHGMQKMYQFFTVA